MRMKEETPAPEVAVSGGTRQAGQASQHDSSTYPPGESVFFDDRPPVHAYTEADVLHDPEPAELAPADEYLKRKGIDLQALQDACTSAVEIRQGSIGLHTGMMIFRELVDVGGNPTGHERILGERISIDGVSKPNDKFTTRGATARGTFTPLGFTTDDLGVIGERVIVCAGLADGYRLYEATGSPVAAGIGENNVGSIADAISESHKGEIIVAVDSDNAGRRAGEDCGWPWACPENVKDWSDLYQAEGLDAVKAQVNRITAPELAHDDGQPEPADLFGQFTTPVFPVDLMPVPIRDYAKDQAELIGVDSAILSMAALGAVAGCLDDRVEIQPKRYDPTWTESARLWIGIIGEPSAKKSPGIAKALSPVRKVAAKWREEYNKKHKEWQEECDRIKREDKHAETPPGPQLKRLTASDVTVEKLGDILHQCEPRGIIIDKDELTGWLASMDAYKQGAGGKDKAAWLEAYNGGGMEIDRVNRGSLWVENWSATVIGGIQPQVITDYANANNHDGMLQRFMLIHASPAHRGVDRHPDMQAKEAYADMMEQLVEVQPGLEPVQLSPEAHEIREAFNDRLHKAVTSMPNRHLTAMLGKWEGLFARVCLAFHAAECACSKDHPSASPVGGETARKVDRLLWHCLLPHAIQFYDGMDPTEDQARQLAGLLLARKWERFTVRRDLNNNMKTYRRMKEWEREEMLDRLEAYGWIGAEPALNERGRPVAYKVNPLVHQRYAEHAEQEKERRRQVAEILGELKEG